MDYNVQTKVSFRLDFDGSGEFNTLLLPDVQKQFVQHVKELVYTIVNNCIPRCKQITVFCTDILHCNISPQEYIALIGIDIASQQGVLKFVRKRNVVQRHFNIPIAPLCQVENI